jgi:hypothetical protein
MTNDRTSYEDWKVLAKYGWAMYGVQSWELSLKQLVQLGLPDFPEDASYEVVWRKVEKLLRRPAGRLKEQLEKQSYGSKDLHIKLEEFGRRRNELAHEFLLHYVLMRQSGMSGVHDAAVKKLAAEGLLFREFSDELSDLSQKRARQRGWDLDKDLEEVGLTPEDLGRIILAEEANEADLAINSGLSRALGDRKRSGRE